MCCPEGGSSAFKKRANNILKCFNMKQKEITHYKFLFYRTVSPHKLCSWYQFKFPPFFSFVLFMHYRGLVYHRQFEPVRASSSQQASASEVVAPKRPRLTMGDMDHKPVRPVPLGNSPQVMPVQQQEIKKVLTRGILWAVSQNRHKSNFLDIPLKCVL